MLVFFRTCARSALWLVPVALLALFALDLRTAGAQPEPGFSRSMDRLALAIAKVAANEASLTHVRPAEVALIHQVTVARADTPRAQLAWLRAHSSCVLGTAPIGPNRGNCVWSRGLSSNERRPEGWPVGLPWSRYASRWAQVREFARRLVSGEETMRPCPGAPWTWGGRDIDMAQALERGLVPLGCRDPQTGELTLNEGFALVRGGASS